MNRDETKQAIAVMQHYADGGDVQMRARDDDDTWMNATHPDGPLWQWDGFEYRIKPKPLECWVLFNRSEYPEVALASSPAIADMVKESQRNARWIRMREVE